MKKILLLLVATSLGAAPAFAQCDASGVTVAFTPAQPVVGQSIQVDVTNNTSACVFTLPSSCAFQSVHEGGCTGPLVFAPICLTVLTPIGPGQTKSMSWDQLDLNGQQVAPGTYSFGIRMFDDTFTPFDVCATIAISDCVPAPEVYGAPKPGSGGIGPVMGFFGEPRIGTFIDLDISGALGNAQGQLWLGSGQANLPIGFGGRLYLDPLNPILMFDVPYPGTPGAPGEGALRFPVQVPNDPTLIGRDVNLQAFVFDAGGTGGFAHTQGLQLTICP